MNKTKVQGSFRIEYDIWRVDHESIPDKHRSELEACAESRIFKMREKGYREGELHYTIEEIEYEGWFKIQTATSLERVASSLSDYSERELIDLNDRVVQAIKSKRKAEAMRKRDTLHEEDRVIINQGEREGEEGTILRVKRTRAIVRVDDIDLDVPLQMLTFKERA